MGLSLPLALLGLLALGIPIWLHRVRRRRIREVRLPTLALVARAKAKRRRVLSLRDVPLLIARLALLLLLCFSIAQPFITGEPSYGQGSPIALMLVLDDSLSMHRQVSGGSTVLDRSLERARDAVKGLASGSQVGVILAGVPARTVQGLTTEKSVALGALADVHAQGARGTDLAGALAAAERELASAQLAERTVVVLSDCTRDSRADELTAGRASLHVECLAEGTRSDNAYLHNVEVESHALDEQFATVLIQLRSTLRTPSIDAVVRVDEQELARETVSISEGVGSARVDLDVRELETARTLRVELLVEDALAADNVREVAIGSAAGVQVLLVDGDPAPNRLDDELRFISVALTLPAETGAPLHVRRTDPEGLSHEDLERTDVVVLANAPVPNEQTAERLEQFVRGGGGLWIAAGDQVDPFGYRGRLGPLLPALPRSAAEAKPATGMRVDSASGPLAGLGIGLETAQTDRRMLVERPTERSRVLLRFADGTPAIIAGRHGEGRTLLLTTTLDDDWSDLPLTPGFLPVVHALVSELAPAAAIAPGPRPAGAPVTLAVPARAARVEILKPDGHREPVDVQDERAVFASTELPGVYRTFSADGSGPLREMARLRFAVVPPTSESELRQGEGPAGDRRMVAAEAAETRRPVAPWTWLLLGLAAIAEGLMRSRRRWKLPGRLTLREL